MDGLVKQHSFYAERVDQHIDEEDSDSHREGLQHMIQVEIEIMRACFETSKNPIFIFRAFMCCVDGRLSIPDWIMDYFYEASLRLLDAAYSGDGRSEKDILAHALDFKSSGRGNYFKQYIENLKQYSQLADVMRVKLSSDLSFEEIEGQVANEAFPDDAEAADKLQRNLRSWREKLQNIPDDLFRR
jgi:hypothetical protein